MTDRARGSVLARLQLGLGSFALLLWSGRDRQRRRFERRLLAAYPALAELSPEEFAAMSQRVTAGVRGSHVILLALAAAVAAAFLMTPVLLALHATLGLRIPIGAKVALVMLASWSAWRVVRRMLIDRQLTTAVSRAYPKLFCACGYCLLGLPASTTHCPECGAVRERETGTERETGERETGTGIETGSGTVSRIGS